MVFLDDFPNYLNKQLTDVVCINIWEASQIASQFQNRLVNLYISRLYSNISVLYLTLIDSLVISQ